MLIATPVTDLDSVLGDWGPTSQPTVVSPFCIPSTADSRLGFQVAAWSGRHLRGTADPLHHDAGLALLLRCSGWWGGGLHLADCGASSHSLILGQTKSPLCQVA